MKSANISLLLGMFILLLYNNPASGEFIPPDTALFLDDGIYSTPQEQYPIYQYDVVTIPRVDTLEKIGIIQDVKFKWIGQDYWRLLDFKLAGIPPLKMPHITSVETIVTDSFPVQVFLKVTGGFSGCGYTLGKIPQRLTGNHFEVFIYEHDIPSPINTCKKTMNIINFETIIPLSVYGLRAGVYEYSLSGGLVSNLHDGVPRYIPKTFTGTFELTQDNIFSR